MSSPFATFTRHYSDRFVGLGRRAAGYWIYLRQNMQHPPEEYASRLPTRNLRAVL